MVSRGSNSVDIGDPQGPLRRVGLALTNGHGLGGSWHGGSVPMNETAHAVACGNDPSASGVETWESEG
jgi:hypothetical protein